MQLHRTPAYNRPVARMNTVGEGPVYTRELFLDWMAPIDPSTMAGETVLEMGFGSGSLLSHVGTYAPSKLAGLEPGDTLTTANPGEFDLVYCIGVLHHLQDPSKGFDAVVRNTRPGGRFHCGVYAAEGNGVVIHVVDPIRRVACRLPRWATKYGLALPLAIPYYAYAKAVSGLADVGGPSTHLVTYLPLAEYSQWIAKRGFRFLHRVAFDQLAPLQTTYLTRAEVQALLRHPDVDPESTYIFHRNGNSWKFGGRRAA